MRADAEQLLQVFLNLSLNALQAMPQGGRLLISTSLRRATRRGAAAAFLEVRFRDTGVGIPPGDLQATFSSRSSRPRRRAPGLGLPISQRIIENHGGTIEVRSQPGEGATFTVLLPIESDAYAAYAEPKTEPRLAAGRADGKKAPPPIPARLPPPITAAGGPAPPPVPPAARGAGAGITAGGRKG